MILSKSSSFLLPLTKYQSSHSSLIQGSLYYQPQTMKGKSIKFTICIVWSPQRGSLIILVIYTHQTPPIEPFTSKSEASYNEVSPPRMCAGATSLWYKATTVLSKPTAQPEIKRPKHIQAIDIAPGRETTSRELFFYISHVWEKENHLQKCP